MTRIPPSTPLPPPAGTAWDRIQRVFDEAVKLEALIAIRMENPGMPRERTLEWAQEMQTRTGDKGGGPRRSFVVKYQPTRNNVSNDEVQTPPELAGYLVDHFKPAGRILEPCRGAGNFMQFLPANTSWCEIREGRDFFKWDQPVNWIITNPPWSRFRPFLRHSMALAHDVVFLVTINHLWTKARLRDIAEAGFGTREIHLVETPATFPATGFQLGAIHLQKGRQSPELILTSAWSISPLRPE